MSKNGFSRKDFLKTGALSTFAFGSGLAGTRLNGEKAIKSAAGQAKNVIFMVSDGMSIGTKTMADQVKRAVHGDKTNWVKLYESDRDFHRGLMDMTTGDSIVPDSAAAASSWGCGKRINNGSVNWGTEDQQYKPICEIFRDAGKATGLVTTTRITHATPAGFAANVPSRGMEDEIAEQYSQRNLDVLMGGGRRHFDPERREDGKDLYKVFTDKDYAIAHTKAELFSADKSKKTLGLFYDSHLPYTMDHDHMWELRQAVPSLAEMTTEALDRLSRNSNGFILQVEGGRVDHAAHGNDPGSLIFDQIAFDDAIGKVMEFTEGRDDTLVVVTTDHGNANPGLNGLGSGYRDSPRMLETLSRYQRSFEWIYGELGYHWAMDGLDTIKAPNVRELVEYATRTQITSEQAEIAAKAFRGEYKAAFHNRQGPGAVLAGILANYNGIYFVGTNHTSDYVEIASWGPGSDRIPSFVRNTAMFDLMVEMAGVQAYADA